MASLGCCVAAGAKEEEALLPSRKRARSDSGRGRVVRAKLGGGVAPDGNTGVAVVMRPDQCGSVRGARRLLKRHGVGGDPDREYWIYSPGNGRWFILMGRVLWDTRNGVGEGGLMAPPLDAAIFQARCETPKCRHGQDPVSPSEKRLELVAKWLNEHTKVEELFSQGSGFGLVEMGEGQVVSLVTSAYLWGLLHPGKPFADVEMDTFLKVVAVAGLDVSCWTISSKHGQGTHFQLNAVGEHFVLQRIKDRDEVMMGMLLEVEIGSRRTGPPRSALAKVAKDVLFERNVLPCMLLGYL